MNSGSNYRSPDKHNRLSQGIAFAAILLAAIFLVHSQISLHAVNAAPTTTPPATKTTADGVYSPDQAAKGKDLYSQNCSACHLDDMSGSGEAPPLAGEGFTDSWDGHTVNELDQTVLNTMPLDNPGSLDPSDALAIVTYIFQKNNMPPGAAPLKNDSATLKDITISTKK
ncbi:MAG TPA: cytochrome c [Candidatus Dormibacteraeota bacterium]|nr:cytochrome c [Candidatus Dormibacteraeota bacterium]